MKFAILAGKVPWTILSSQQSPLKYPCIYKGRFGSGSKSIQIVKNITEANYYKKLDKKGNANILFLPCA